MPFLRRTKRKVLKAKPMGQDEPAEPFSSPSPPHSSACEEILPCTTECTCTNVLEEKAASLDPPCTYAQLKNFFLGMRTRFGKLTASKSGQATARMTERDRFVVTTFQFLDTHIRRCPSRSSTQFSQDTKESLDSEQEVEVDEGDTGYEASGDENQPSTSAPIPPMFIHPSKKKYKKTPPDDDAGAAAANDALFAKLMNRADELADSRREKDKAITKTQHQETVDQFVGYMRTQLYQVKPDVWFDYTMASQQLIHEFIVKGNHSPPTHTETPPPAAVYHLQPHHPGPCHKRTPPAAYGSPATSTYAQLQPVSYTPAIVYEQHVAPYNAGFNIPTTCSPGLQSLFKTPPILTVSPSRALGNTETTTQALNIAANAISELSQMKYV